MPVPVGPRLVITIQSPGFHAHVTVHDDRDLDEVIDAVSYAAKRQKPAPEPEPAPPQVTNAVTAEQHDDAYHAKAKAAIQEMVSSFCDELVEETRKIVTDESERRGRLS